MAYFESDSEEPRSGVSKDECHQRGLMVRDGAEPVIGPRYARTRWRLLTMRGSALNAA
jgi:hypothetical protein